MSRRKDFARSTHIAVSRNKILAKRVAWQLISLIGNILLLLFKLVWLALAIAGGGLSFLGRVLGIKIIGLPAYRLFKKIEAVLSAIRTYLRREWGENFRRNFIIYGGLAVLASFVIAANLKAQGLRPEDIGRQSALYQLLGQDSESNFIIEESELGEESMVSSPKDRGLSELGVESQVSEPPGPESLAGTDYVSPSGDALIKPELYGRGEEAPLRDSIVMYTVREGDTISEIADEFGVSVNTILWENKLGERDFIKPGQQLAILPVTGVSHEVKRGETVAGLAKKYSAKAEDILEVNKLSADTTLAAGAKIIIPDGVPPQEQRTVVPEHRLAGIRDIFRPVRRTGARFLWPTISRRITQYFRGWRHTGLDIAAPTGQPIYAADDGVVVTAGWNRGGYGLYIVIDHGGGVQTLYSHNSKNYVKRGDRVRRGETIGAIGSTGRSTGPHVHFEVRIGGNRLNPLGYL